MQVVSRFTPMATPAKPAIAPRSPTGAIEVQHLRAPEARQVSKAERESGFLNDIIDIINPLQHIPVISTLYRKLTGDEIGQAPRIAGDTLYGGVFGSFLSGLVSSVANVLVEAATGRDIGAHIMAAAVPAEEPFPAVVQRGEVAGPATLEAHATDHESPVRAVDATVQPEPDYSLMQTAVEQYQWHMLEDEEEERPGYWA